MIRTTVINAVVLGGVALCGTATAWTDDASLRGRIVAIGIPGIAAIGPVGTFLPGGPIHNKPALAAYTQPGQALDPARILVRSESSFGEPEAVAGQLHGSFLSAFTMRLSWWNKLIASYMSLIVSVIVAVSPVACGQLRQYRSCFAVDGLDLDCRVHRFPAPHAFVSAMVQESAGLDLPAKPARRIRPRAVPRACTVYCCAISTSILRTTSTQDPVLPAGRSAAFCGIALSRPFRGGEVHVAVLSEYSAELPALRLRQRSMAAVQWDAGVLQL